MRTTLGIVIIIIALGLVGLSLSTFTVDETEQAVVLQLGEPIGEVRGPGLHFKIPFAQSVRYFDARLLAADPEAEQMVISSSDVGELIKKSELEQGKDEVEKTKSPTAPQIISAEPIIVDTFARYRISDPLAFMRSLRTIRAANARIKNIMNDATRSVLGKTTLTELLSEKRSDIMKSIQKQVNDSISNEDLGITLEDIRIVRADLTPQLRQSTVRRMISQLNERATEIRANGEENARKIRAKAERERTVLLAEAERKAQALRGEGDEKAIKVYTDSFNKDQEFYAFMRSLEAYRTTLATPETRLVLSPDSAFFRYFTGKQSAGK